MNSIDTSRNMSAYGVARNIFVKISTIGVIIAVEIWYTRFLLKQLGVELYGLILLTTNVIAFAAVFSNILINSIGRFTAIEIHRGQVEAANRAFNSCFFTCLFFCLFLLTPIFSAISWFAPELFQIPAGSENTTRTLFAAVTFSFIFALIASALSVGTFVYNRLDLNDIMNLFKILISRISSALLIAVAGLGLYGVSCGLLGASFFMLFSGLYLFKRLMPDIRISRRYWDKALFDEVSAFMGWAFLRQLSATGLIYLDMLIVNRLYGPVQTGLFAIAVFFPTKLKLLTGTFSALLNPVILRKFTLNDIEGMMDITCRAIRMTGIVFGLPVGLLCGLYRPIFNVWIGAEYESIFLLSIVLTCHVSVNTSCYPLFAIQNVANKLKVPAIVATGLVFIYIPLAITLGGPSFGFGLTGIALAGTFTWTLNHAIFSPYYIGHILNRSPKQFYLAFLPGLTGMSVVFFCSYAMSSCEITFSIPGLAITMLIISISYCFFSLFILLPSTERNLLRRLVRYRLKGI